MKRFLCALAVVFYGILVSDAEDRGGLELLPDDFVTTNLNVVRDYRSSCLKPLDKKKWMQIKMPNTMKKHFKQPTEVWEIKGGYFATFNKGEVLCVLCYASKKNLIWFPLMPSERDVLGVYVSQVVKLDEETYVLAGGGFGINIGSGALYTVSFSNKEPEIKCHVISRASSGIPTLCGRSSDLVELGTREGLVVYSVTGQFNKNEQLYGISKSGRVFHLGKYSVLRTKELQADQAKGKDKDKNKGIPER